MLDCRKLDELNNYSPNLQEGYECARRQYLMGDKFFNTAELEISETLKKENNAEILSISCEYIIEQLAFACESYLKAIYLYENNISNTNGNQLWENLFKKIKSKGKNTGHELDILIELLKPETRNLIEVRLKTIPINETEKYKNIGFYDILVRENKAHIDEKMTEDEKKSWLEKHRRAFIDMRYSGQELHDRSRNNTIIKRNSYSVEFMYHLATQIKATANFIISPKQNQIFSEEVLNKIENLPEEIKKLYRIKNTLISEKLISLIIENEEKKKLLIDIINNEYLINNLKFLNSTYFYELIKNFNIVEINQSIIFSNYNITFEELLNSIDNNYRWDKKYDYNTLQNAIISRKDYLKTLITLKTMYNFIINEKILKSIKYLLIKQKIEETKKLYIMIQNIKDSKTKI